MRHVRALAAAQTVPVPGDVDANIAQHLLLARVAAAEGAAVVVFPELSLTGYELALGPVLAFSDDDARLAPLCESARANATLLIVGAPLRRAGKLQIGAFILYPDGTRAIHEKCHLGAFSPDVNPNGSIPPAESTIFEPGSSCPLVRLGDHQGVVAVCAESLQPAVAKEAAARGAKTYLTGHFAIPSDRELRIAALARYAAHYQMAVVFSTYGGPTGGLPASGGSAIISQTGELLVQLGAQGSGLAVAHEDASGWRAHAVML